MQLLGRGKGLKVHGRYLGGKRYDDVHAAGRWGYSDNPLEVVVERIDQQPLTAAVNRPRPPDMRRIVTLLDEVAKRGLNMERRLATGQKDRSLHPFRKRPWYDHVADAQTGEERFRKGSDMDDTAVGIPMLKSHDRRTGIAEFAVIVVFDDPR